MASDYTIKVKGMDAVKNKIKRMAKKSPEAAAKAINKSLLVIEKEVKGNLTNNILNVDTGRLRKSFGVASANQANPRKLQGNIGSNVVYAKIHETGGQAGRDHKVRIPARYYFSKAIKASTSKINRIFSNAAGDIIKA